MAQPILSIEEQDSDTKVVANLLPCRIHHDGPVDPITGYWKPSTAEDGSKTAYLRGRKLHGKTVAIPKEYRGIVVERKTDGPTQQTQPPTAHNHDDDGDDDLNIIGDTGFEKGALQITGEFDEMIVWGHEALADATGDPYIRSVEEWLQVADQIHAYPEANGAGTK